MSNYTKELKADRKVKLLRMQAIVGDGKRSLSAADRSEFDDLEWAIRAIDTRISQARDDTPRGDYSGKRKRTTADDDAVYVLSSRQVRCPGIPGIARRQLDVHRA